MEASHIEFGKLDIEKLQKQYGLGDLLPGPPHEALFFVLAYLPVFELLAMSQACRSLRDAVNNDCLVWLNIIVDRPLSSQISNEFLMKIASKSNGKLQFLALKNCTKITDDGLQRVIEQNPLIIKLYLPGCTGLTPEGVIRAVETLTKDSHNLEGLKISGIYHVNKQHLETLQSCLLNRPPRQVQPSAAQNPKGTDRLLDVEICPVCDNVRMVYDCSRESCRRRERPMSKCRGCCYCIPWCQECRGCVDEPEEAACADVLCSDCWLKLPKCSFCNKPYCRRHADQQCRSSRSSTMFLCGACDSKFINHL